ncbi:heparinase II/III-family protein [Paenibacillus spongiae]|uniref:Heparinase II/III-family protein n=1 Tax=Paenibacillus spongiae TaxID=2909671 RepID=A0ABY5SFQ8_9BACL|nr:heparinase II/III-family protein [Paenibacillus spongiae]UVI32811.1 heparinase II/III-family protein [Paenibacillus spongiae]
MNKQTYLDYIKAAVIEGRTHYDAGIEQWRQSYRPDQFLGMYAPPGSIPILAQTEAFLYHVTGEAEYGEQARRILLAVESFKDIVPDFIKERHPEYAEGITSFEPLFQGTHYIQGYLFMKDSALLSDDDKRQIEGSIRSSVQAMLHYPEWGAHNRSMLRVFTLSLAISALGDTEEIREWAKLRDYLAEESYGGWSIEDAELYLPLWLISCIIYAEMTGKESEYFAMPQTKYYFDYITHALIPYGQLPDFGDSHYNSCWYLWLACLEKGAAHYRCGYMKYAASKIYEYFLASHEGPPSAYLAAYFSNAYLWSDDELEPVRPDWQSEELLEDVIGKKIVYRDGWEDDSTYMLLNYRDEGDYAYIPREYLRRTIHAPAEKAHHGHADENSILFLAKKQNILLHDGGYRDGAPNGRYRADIYHNRLVFRDGEPGKNDSIFDFIHDDGTYKRVSTEKLHFQRFGELVYGRTRLREPFHQILWDRAVTYLQEEGVFIIVDWTQSQSESDKLLSTLNLWHPGSVLASGEQHYVGQVQRIHQGPGDTNPIVNRTELALLIEFPGSARRTGQETIKRCYADSEMVYEMDTRRVTKGSMNSFVTVLTPFALTDTADPVRDRVRISRDTPEHDRLSLSYTANGKSIHLTYKLDLDQGILEGEGYPKYKWEQGRLNYGPIDTDADFSFVREDGIGPRRYGFVNGCGIEFNGSLLFRTPQMSAYQFHSSSFLTSDHKWRAWDGSFG